jgi:hypothetical protein
MVTILPEREGISHPLAAWEGDWTRGTIRQYAYCHWS